MKIRTDFVTNSSSSSFCVEIEVETKEGSRFVFETRPTEQGANADLQCTPEQILKMKDVEKLCWLLNTAMSGTGKRNMKAFTQGLVDDIASIDDVTTITLRKIWYAWGEAASCQTANDKQLIALSEAVVASNGDAQAKAIEDLRDYLETAEIHVKGGWSDSWPTGFCKKGVPHYRWDCAAKSLLKLAEKVVNEQNICGDDWAVETVFIDMQKKTYDESAEYLLWGSEKDIGKKPACNSSNVFRSMIKSAASGHKMCTDVSVSDLIEGYETPCDPIDFVIYDADLPKVAISVKTAANSRSKTFKAIKPACESIGLAYVILDEKKDTTAPKVESKLNEAWYQDIFHEYVVTDTHTDIPFADALQSGEGCTVKVKFADSRSYDYNCFSEINIGDIVYVDGAKSDCRGMVVLLTGKRTFEGYRNITKIMKNN